MKVIKKGSGDAELAVVACMHGDEVCGKKAIEEFLETDMELHKPVKFIVANEEAMEEGERFLDTDLNRCFPGDRESDQHEERLAAELMEELEGLKTLTIHSMENFEEIFCLVNEIDNDLVNAPGVGKAVDVGPLVKDSIEKYLDAVSVETGSVGSDTAERNSHNVMLNFLAYFGALDRKTAEESPELFRMYEVVEGDYDFLADNFVEVKEGEKFAENDEGELRAEEAFYPILMSTDGYDEILGFKGRRIGAPDSSARDSVDGKSENELKDER